MPWTTRDIVALTLLKQVTSADVMRLATTCENLEHALEVLGGGRDLFSGAESLSEIAETSISRCAKLEIDVVTWLDPHFPDKLLGLAAQPAVLYVRGKLEQHASITDEHSAHLAATAQTRAPHIAVVGTRSCTLHYGRTVTDMLVRSWCRKGATIVSGLAAGIDTHAHEACLAMHGRTIAVIASGIDRITPNDARRLADSIVENNGAIVTEYRCGVAALPPYFPARNRIICGLSDAVVVVESKRTGGALITAAFAEKYNRLLYAVPGPITSTRSDGTNELIRSRRATALLDAEAVVADITSFYDLSEWSWDLQLVRHSDSPTTLGLSPIQKRILEALDVEPMHVDALAVKCEIAVPELLGELLTLELMSYVEQSAGQVYSLQ